MTHYEVYARSPEGPIRVAAIEFESDFNHYQAREWAEQIRDVFHDHYHLHSIRCTNPSGELPCRDEGLTTVKSEAMREVMLNVFKAARRSY